VDTELVISTHSTEWVLTVNTNNNNNNNNNNNEEQKDVKTSC
jgi:hypothetical protein